MKEYVIWGVAPQGNSEVLLLAKINNRFITDSAKAEELRLLLERNGCTNTRIQELDFNNKCINETLIKAINSVDA